MRDTDHYPATLEALDAASVALMQVTRSVATAVDQDRHDRLGGVRLIELAAEQFRRSLVAVMREEGQTWQQIADTLGVTRQAVQQRYGA